MLAESRCPGCGRTGWCPCPRCVRALQPPDPAVVDGAVTTNVLFSHEGPGRSFIHAIKFDGDRSLVGWLADAMARRAQTYGVHIVTWAPTSTARRRERGFDQSRLLAKAVARRLRVPCRNLLVRAGGPQEGRGRAERLAGPRFEARRTGRGERVLLLDDVLTTGASLEAATRALGVAGFGPVHAAAFSRTSELGIAEAA